MNVAETDLVTSRSLVAHYILDCKQRGHVLPYGDYDLIDQWLAHAPSVDHLLVILSDLLPPFFRAKGEQGRMSPSLRGVHKSVLSALKACS